MAWKVKMMVLSFQARAEWREEGCHVQLKKEVFIGHLGRKGSTWMSATSLPNLIWRSLVFVQDQMSGGAFFSYHTCTDNTSPQSLGVIWVVLESWYSPFQGDWRAVLVLSDSKLEGWQKLEDFGIQSNSQVCKKISKTINRTRIWYTTVSYGYYWNISIRHKARLICLKNKSSFNKLACLFTQVQ